MLRILLAPVALLTLLMETIDDPGPTEDTVLLDEEAIELERDTKIYPLDLTTKRELRLLTYEVLLISWKPWTRRGKRVKRIAEELLEEVRSGPRDTGTYSN